MTDLEDVSEPIPEPQSEVIPIAPSSVDVFEWLRRGDGTFVLYKNGQVCGDPEEITAHFAERPV